MKDFKVLKLIDKFKGFYKSFGVNYDVMRLILKTKLIMDRRKVPTIFNNHKQYDRENTNSFYTTLGYYAFIGFSMMFIVIIKVNIMI